MRKRTTETEKMCQGLFTLNTEGAQSAQQNNNAGLRPQMHAFQMLPNGCPLLQMGYMASVPNMQMPQPSFPQYPMPQQYAMPPVQWCQPGYPYMPVVSQMERPEVAMPQAVPVEGPSAFPQGPAVEVAEPRMPTTKPAAPVRVTIEDMHEEAKKKKGKCLATEVVNKSRKIDWECERGHNFSMAPSHVLRGHWCGLCFMDSKRLTLDQMHEMAAERNGTCKSEEYRNNYTKLNWECEKSHDFWMSAEDVKKGHWCPTCYRERRWLNIDQMRDLAKEQGGECLSQQYKNNRTKLTWKCKLGHTFEMKPSSVKQGRWCSVCSRERRSRNSAAKSRAAAAQKAKKPTTVSAPATKRPREEEPLCLPPKKACVSRNGSGECASGMGVHDDGHPSPLSSPKSPSYGDHSSDAASEPEGSKDKEPRSTDCGGDVRHPVPVRAQPSHLPYGVYFPHLGNAMGKVNQNDSAFMPRQSS